MSQVQSREGRSPSRSNGGAPSVDLLTQACKALCERSPYDPIVDDGVQGGAGRNMPAGFAVLVRQPSIDGRRRRKKSHSGKGKESVWVETEEYFRELTVGDVEELGRLGSVSSLIQSKSFLIPYLGVGNSNVGNVSAMEKEGRVKDEGSGSSSSGSLVLDSARGLEWIIAYRNKDYLNTERPTRKRKKLGSDAGLEKVLVPCPCEGNSSICDYCCTGDVRGELNPLITCSSCEVVVHKRCYGVQEVVSDSWLCSWCSQMSVDREAGTPCVLCSKSRGALKPVHKSDEQTGAKDFVHLFCAQWIPEVNVEDVTRMESVINLGEINDVRRKLICNICKVKRGACVRCSRGSCRTSFHPICAREAGQRMEIWGKYGCDDVELRAFCSKHSEAQTGTGIPKGLKNSRETDQHNGVPVDESLNLALILSKNATEDEMLQDLTQDKDAILGQDVRNPSWSDAANQVFSDLINMGAVNGYSVHPHIHKLWDMQLSEFEGVKAGRVGVLDISPEDEVEGELIYYQHKLLSNAIASRQLTGNLASEVTKRLPHEIELARRQGWDAVVANQYLCELADAKKRSRKERKHIEEQDDLPPANAATAASSRASAFRIDPFDDSVNQAEDKENKFKVFENLQHIRVGLERLRLLCERIVRREKMKHDTVSCTNEILAAKRDCIGYSLFVNNLSFHHDVSSESVTTSLGGHTDDDYKSLDEMLQNSVDVTVDSCVSVKPEVVDYGCMDADERTDDSSITQQNSFTEHLYTAYLNNHECREK